MINLQHLTLRRGTKVLLDDVSLTLYAKQKIGLIGDNGCGKTSFFAMLQGELEPYKGELALPNSLEIAHVRQETPALDRSALDYVIDGDLLYRRIEKDLIKAEETADAKAMARGHDELAHIDGYSMTGKAEKILIGLGFRASELSQPTKAFSGGWRMRLNLAQALMSRATLMLLDEPTNHLDIDAIIWLERWLQDYAGTVFIISHDREFLDNTVNHILHFHSQLLQLYRGNFSSFEEQRAMQMALQQAAFVKQQAHIAHMQSFVDRCSARASTAKQAQSRLKAIEKIERVTAVVNQGAFTFSFKKPKDCPNPLIRIDNIDIGYNDKSILTQVMLQLAPSDRIGLLGVNGAGKSTLIKAIAGLIKPQSGQIHFYKGLKIGYFAQHQVEHLDLQLSPLSMMQELAPGIREQELRGFLGSFNFSGEKASEKIEHFSGGEKARLALALIVWQSPNLILLDEPTNHLDMNMREALILALQTYTGALILVSHDRHLIRTSTDELMIVHDGEVSRFSGDLEDYRDITLQKTSSPKAKKPSKDTGKDRRKLENRLASLERDLLKLREKMAKIDLLLSDAEFYNKPSDLLQETLKQQENLRVKMKTTEDEWLLTQEQLEE